MPRPNLFKRAIAASQRQVGFWLSLESLKATEVAVGANFDWLLLDMEHSGLSLDQAVPHLLAARQGPAELILRIPYLDPPLVKRALDCGFRSLMFPMIETAEMARQAVAATVYPPDGMRGVSGAHRGNDYGRDAGYAAGYRDAQCVIVQVESPAAVAAIPEIGAVDGVDGIFIGPNDLSASMGLFGQLEAPAVKTAISDGLAAIHSTGKGAGSLSFREGRAAELLSEGFEFIAVGSDQALLRQETDRLRAALAGRPG
jgi:4-hydroxy-2-oxoheptanedioate aldolase